jgi:hypothetical protein
VAAVATIWRGDTVQLRALLSAIERNCSCKELRGCCPPHHMLLEQRLLDSLLFMRFIQARLMSGEFDV